MELDHTLGEVVQRPAESCCPDGRAADLLRSICTWIESLVCLRPRHLPVLQK